jgi:hypothetical protein
LDIQIASGTGIPWLVWQLCSKKKVAWWNGINETLARQIISFFSCIPPILHSLFSLLLLISYQAIFIIMNAVNFMNENIPRLWVALLIFYLTICWNQYLYQLCMHEWSVLAPKLHPLQSYSRNLSYLLPECKWRYWK